MTTITLNGKPRALNGAVTVASLLKALALRAEQVAVAINGEVVPRDSWALAAIGDGDVVEVVRAVGGG